MSIFSIFIRIIIVISLVVLKLYWSMAEKEAYIHLPKTTVRRHRFVNHIRYAEYILYVIFLIQLIGYPIIGFTPNIYTELIGMIIFFLGVRMSLEGRKALGHNWTHAIDYQVKARQALVTRGIYKRVRHPIYAGGILMITGLEIALNSWLFIPSFLFVFTVFYAQSIKEESILARHFQKEYLMYMHHSKMFFPYLF